MTLMVGKTIVSAKSYDFDGYEHVIRKKCVFFDVGCLFEAMFMVKASQWCWRIGGSRNFYAGKREHLLKIV